MTRSETIRKAARIWLMRQLRRTELLISFGNHLKQMRLAKGLTFRMLQQRSGVEKRTLTKCEQGCFNPGMSIILKVAKGLDVHYRELLNFSFDGEARVNEYLKEHGTAVDPISILLYLMTEQKLRRKDVADILHLSR